ncbi:FeoA family protein [Lachnospiraceae bacterium 62-35]
MVIPLNKMECGGKGRVVWIASDEVTTARLQDLGFVSEEVVSCVLEGKQERMRAYLIRNTIIGIRDSSAAEIFVRLIEDCS